MLGSYHKDRTLPTISIWTHRFQTDFYKVVLLSGTINSAGIESCWLIAKFDCVSDELRKRTTDDGIEILPLGDFLRELWNGDLFP